MKLTVPSFNRLFGDREKPSPIGLPQNIILELTNKCNLECIMCHVHSGDVKQKRKEGFMEEYLWKKVIDEISSWEYNVNLSTFGAGETLLHPQIVDVVKYAGTRTNITVGFLTNAMLLDRKKTAGLLNACIDWIAISLDGTDRNFVEHYRRGSNLEKIETNIIDLINEKGQSEKPHIKLNMVLLPGAEAQVNKFIKRWLPMVNEISVSKYRPLGEKHFLTIRQQRRPCRMLNEMMVIAWNGDVGLCCEDNFCEHKTGNVINCSIKDVWYGKRFQGYRNLHLRGKYDKMKLCKNCDVWSTNVALKQYVNEEGYFVEEYTNLTVYKVA